MSKKVRWGLIALICLVIIGLGTYRYIIPLLENTDKEEPVKPVVRNTARTLNVNGLVIKKQSLTDELITTGSLIPDEEVDLAFETSGMITEINFKEGTDVKQGQLLAKVNDKPLQAQLLKLTAQVKLAEDRVFRQNALLLKDAVSKEAYEQVRTELETLKADIELVKANIAQTELRAPFDGVIGLRQVSVGSYASPNTVVATLTRVTPLKVEFSIPERHANNVAKGTKLTFSVEGKLVPYNATVYATESRISADTRTLTIRALYPNTDGLLLPGRYATVNVKLNEIPNAIAIPTEAIVPELGVDKVYVYRSGKAQPVEVTTGLRTDAEVQIVKGLQVGDTLITSGTLQLRTGIDVVLDYVQ